MRKFHIDEPREIGKKRDRVSRKELNMVKDEIIFEAGSRVRDVEIGPNGMIYVALEDPGRIVKISRYSK